MLSNIGCGFGGTQYTVSLFCDSLKEREEISASVKNVFIQLVVIKDLEEFKKIFVNSKVIIIHVKDEELFKNTMRFINKNKINQIVIVFCDEHNSESMKCAITARPNNILFTSSEYGELEEITNSYYREEYLFKEAIQLQGKGLNELNIDEETFIKGNKKYLITALRKFEEVLSDKDIIVSKSNRCSIYEFSDEDRDALHTYVLNILGGLIDDSRQSNTMQMTKYMIHKFPNVKAEDIIGDNVFNVIVDNFKKKGKKNKEIQELADVLFVIFMFKKRKIAEFSKTYIRDQLSKKEHDLTSSSLFYLMTGISHHQNNLFVPVEIESKIANKLIFENLDSKKKEKTLSLYQKSKDAENFAIFKNFLSNISELFCSYCSSKIDGKEKNIEYLEFLIRLVFVDGLRLSHNNINIIVTNTVGTSQYIKIDESILLSSLLAVVENSIDSGAKNIIISIEKKYNIVGLRIKNDGKIMTELEKKRLFQKHYSSKNMSGLGLFIAKRDLNSMGKSLIFYETQEQTEFIIRL